MRLAGGLRTAGGLGMRLVRPENSCQAVEA